ncbi:signal transduction histidine kinase [Allocatelliglobosispora scoriae]|uniref:histidine kinase n=1 Tax=Allocatelliglobosispora scoriae TaxID=643052 RepID=A0A841C5L1_9ACTN|nr:ATP-binding protein [Allocatelliglobosispora scoriae]MBB5874413.1 signal transduction histidine kinase [Allocatelliglobosispora scoriae]
MTTALPAGPVRRRVAAWTVASVTGLLTAAAFAAWIAVQPSATATQLYALVDLADGIVYGAVAWLILGRRTHLTGWIVAAAAIGGAFSAFSSQWELLAVRHPQLWAPDLLIGAHTWAWLPGLYGLVVLLPWLLPADAPGRGLRVVRAAAVSLGIGYVIAAVLVALTNPAPYGLFHVTDPELRRLRVEILGPAMYAVIPLGLLATAGVLRRRHTEPRAQRHGLGWLAVGSTLLSFAFAIASLPPSFAERLPAQAPALLMLASQLFFPAAVLVVVLRQQLWGIDLAVQRTLVWLLMTAVVIAGYTGGVLLLDRVLPADSFVPKVLVTAVLAAAFQPLRQWVQRRVDRLVHGEGREPLMRQVVQRLGSAGHDEPMIDTVASAIASSLRLDRVTITVYPLGSAPGAAAGAVPGSGGPPVRVPLVSGERTVGELVAWPRPGERLGGRAAAALADLAPVAGAVVDLAVTNEALAGSRRRLAEARDEERRTLRRDLHDGLGPALSGIGLGLAATRNLLHRDLAAAEQLLERLTEEMNQRAESVRHLARALLPADLADGDLLPALHTLAERYALAGFAVTVSVDPSQRQLSGEVATAVYGVVAEAVRNVHRHARVERCDVLVETQDGELQVTVVDHGTGPTAGRSAGMGLQSMRERADAVGGSLTVEPTRPTGTTVRLRVPRQRVAA